MQYSGGKYLTKPEGQETCLSYFWIPLSLYYIEAFSALFLLSRGTFSWNQLWPLAFGLLWATLLGSLFRALPWKAGRLAFAVTYGFMAVYAGFQTGYYLMFTQMMWISDFRYASEGADYAGALLAYPALWWVGIAVMIALGVFLAVKFPRYPDAPRKRLILLVLAAASAAGAFFLPEVVFLSDRGIRYAGSDYGRAQSAEAAYDNMFNTHRLYQVCGIYQTAVKDLYANCVYPLTPGYLLEQQESVKKIDTWFQNTEKGGENAMTGLLEGKNVVLVLMESMDDWMIGEHTPTLTRLMGEGISFTRFYTPGYGGIRTFNTEFCINTGSFLSSRGGYAFDYVTNTFDQSLANAMGEAGYSAKMFHYNDPSFYSRGEFSGALGYEEYVCYDDYVTETDEKERKQILYDDLLLFENQGLSQEFFRPGKRLNFVITRSAHLSYKYNEVLSHWGLKKYPQYRGMTGNEETDCAYLKARLVDDFFARLLTELEAHGELDNTVIIGVTDHYTYGYKNTEALLELSGVENTLLLERTPCFIWSPGLEAREVDKVLNTSDLMPTVLNLLGIDSGYSYIGNDAFDDGYDGFVPFSNGSWIYGDVAYDAAGKKFYSLSGNQSTVSAELQKELARRVQEFVEINNLILDTDYYYQP